MNPIQRQLDAKSPDCNLEFRSRSFVFVHDLEIGSRTLLDSMHREVDAKSSNLRSRFGSFAFLHNLEDA